MKQEYDFCKNELGISHNIGAVDKHSWYSCPFLECDVLLICFCSRSKALVGTGFVIVNDFSSRYHAQFHFWKRSQGAELGFCIIAGHDLGIVYGGMLEAARCAEARRRLAMDAI